MAESGISPLTLLNEFTRGFNVGIATLAALVVICFALKIPVRTTAASLVICFTVLGTSIGAIFADYVSFTNCFLAVKLLYSGFLVQAVAYWSFQADLTYTVTLDTSTTIAYTPYIIITAFIIRVSAGSYTVYAYDARQDEATQLCQVFLPKPAFLLDKVCEIIFSVTMAVLFLYPIICSIREINSLALDGQQSSSSHTPQPSIQMNSIVQGREWLKAIVKNRGFVLVLSVLVEVAHIACVLQSSDPTLLTTWNGYFAGKYVLLITLHICATVATSMINKSKGNSSDSHKEMRSIKFLAVPCIDDQVPLGNAHNTYGTPPRHPQTSNFDLLGRRGMSSYTERHASPRMV
ncbi:hypothetical protein BC830DRAFT_267981 [Chytriomyces sp. MP71]|nr:hypothetical protein BC830DRAFT_267981 [Chytriomyces sp. MP71]